MSRKWTMYLGVCMALLLGAGFVAAEPSSKATAKVGFVAAFESGGDFQTILQQDIKTANWDDLLVDVSLECGLGTETNVKSKGGNRDTAVAEAGVYIRVMVDDKVAMPGEVVFCRRTQELTAVFDGLLSGCLVQDPTCTDEQIAAGDCGLVIDPVCLENDLLPEEVGLFLDTMNANSFNFVESDLSPGMHTIKLQARIATSTCTYAGDVEPEACPDDGLGSASATGTLGKGTVTVETVRFIKGEDVELN